MDLVWWQIVGLVVLLLALIRYLGRDKFLTGFDAINFVRELVYNCQY